MFENARSRHVALAFKMWLRRELRRLDAVAAQGARAGLNARSRSD
jgi:hypothetical protein